MSTLKQSDKQDSYSTGMVRDSQEGKTRPDLISPYFIKRLADRLRDGAEHYGERNWELGQPMSRALASLERHLLEYKLHELDEDHLAGAAFNLMVLMHQEEMLAAGAIPVALDDLAPPLDEIAWKPVSEMDAPVINAVSIDGKYYDRTDPGFDEALYRVLNSNSSKVPVAAAHAATDEEPPAVEDARPPWPEFLPAGVQEDLAILRAWYQERKLLHLAPGDVYDMLQNAGLGGESTLEMPSREDFAEWLRDQ